MNEFKEALRFQPEEKDRMTSSKRKRRTNIKGHRTIYGKFLGRILAVVLVAGVVAGVTKGCGEITEEKIDTLPEAAEHNLKSSDLQIPQELYERIIALKSELEVAKQNDFEDISNIQLINYLSELKDLYLEILKSKVSTITGLDTSEFTLIEPNPSGSNSTLIKDPNKIEGIGAINSEYANGYMNDIGTLKNLAEDANSEDMNRSKLQKYILDYGKKLDGLTTLRMGIEEKKDGRKEIYTYYLTENDLTKNSQTKDDGDER